MNDDQRPLARVASLFAQAVENLRTRRAAGGPSRQGTWFRHGTLDRTDIDADVPFEERERWGEDEEEDGGLAASGVPRRPPDKSGWGAGAVREPEDDGEPRP